MRNINEIIIHCSATVEGKDITANDIKLWHVRDRKFVDIGYHYVIRLDGTIERGRPIEQVGAHCKGHNANSIGICYVGGLDTSRKAKDTRTPQQRHSMKILIYELLGRFPNASVHGHNEYMQQKACPCFDVRKEWEAQNLAAALNV